MRAALLVGGERHATRLTVDDLDDVVLPSPLDAASIRYARDERYTHEPITLFGRQLHIYRHERTTIGSRQIPYTVLGFNGQEVYALGCPACDGRDPLVRPVLFIPEAGPPEWRDLGHLHIGVAVTAARLYSLRLFGRCTRVAVPVDVLTRPDFDTWRDQALAQALLSHDALELWKAAAQ